MASFMGKIAACERWAHDPSSPCGRDKRERGFRPA